MCRSCRALAENSSLDANGNWKGGKTRHTSGYVMQMCADHPRANNGYVLQHIIVMEGIVGRKLVKGETVHHKNGIKDDNRPENLELWVSSHPSGQRVSDIVEWAKSIIDRYG